MMKPYMFIMAVGSGKGVRYSVQESYRLRDGGGGGDNRDARYQPTMAMLNNFMGLMSWLRRTLPLFSLVIKAT